MHLVPWIFSEVLLLTQSKIILSAQLSTILHLISFRTKLYITLCAILHY